MTGITLLDLVEGFDGLIFRGKLILYYTLR